MAHWRGPAGAAGLCVDVGLVRERHRSETRLGLAFGDLADRHPGVRRFSRDTHALDELALGHTNVALGARRYSGRRAVVGPACRSDRFGRLDAAEISPHRPDAWSQIRPAAAVAGRATRRPCIVLARFEVRGVFFEARAARTRN